MFQKVRKTATLPPPVPFGGWWHPATAPTTPNPQPRIMALLSPRIMAPIISPFKRPKRRKAWALYHLLLNAKLSNEIKDIAPLAI